MESYDIFLDYYDKIVRNINNPLEEEVEFLIEDCIKEYKPDTKNILELACGTGVVAKEFKKAGFDVLGLDINEKMLEKAEKNIGKENLVLGDMTNFNIEKKFDTVLCNYNSICHLLTWKDWQKFFSMSYSHLEKDGLLIFDINTIYEFESITKDFAQFYDFGEDTVCLEMFKQEKHYEWLVKIFKKSGDGKFDLIQESIKENSFEIEKIKEELSKKGFNILNVIDYHYGEVREESERVYFICSKK